MNKKDRQSKPLLAFAGALALSAAVSGANAACKEPALELNIPDGKTASSEVMQSAQQAVKQAVQQGEAFVVCVNESVSNRIRAEKLANEMLDKMQSLAAAFNRQLRYHRRAN